MTTKIIALLLFSTHLYAWTDSTGLNHLGSPLKTHVPDEFVWASKTLEEVKDLKQAQRIHPNVKDVLVSYRKAGDNFHTTLLTIKNRGQESARNEMEELSRRINSLWVHPLFTFQGDPREVTPNDPLLEKQKIRHSVMENYKAWDISMGDQSIIVAAPDDGLDTGHEDLKENIWINKGELPDNGIDDDNNGYIDDVKGWDFTDDDNQASPTRGSHGTHVGGIIASPANNFIGGAGTAPHVTLLPVRFYGGKNRWTAALILKSYKYAADNGAHIMTTSYNIDRYNGDPIFLEALNYSYSKGMLLFNSGGNGNTDNPRRKSFEQLLLVVSTKGKVRSSFSNYGTELDLSAPGSDIYATLPKQQYGSKSGTSMAAPNAAAVAALIWSAHPNWTRDQVAAQLIHSTISIDDVNASYKGKMGAGLVNSYNALKNTINSPTVKGLSTEGTGKINSGSTTVKLHLKSILDGLSLAKKGALTIQKLNSSGEVVETLQSKVEGSYFVGTNFIKISVPSLNKGKYQIVADASIIKDPFGNELDGNGDGTPGDDYKEEFTVD